jgi:ribonuclease PH
MLSNCFNACVESRPPDFVSTSTKISFETSIVSGVSGSALSVVGSTKILCTVLGPRPNRNNVVGGDSGLLNCSVKFAPFSSSYSDHDLLSLEKKISQEVRDAIIPSILLENYPKACIDVHVLILSSGGNETAAAIMASSLALVDSSIEVIDLVSSLTVSVSNIDEDSGKLQIFPSFSDGRTQVDNLTCSILPSTGSITQVQLNGKLAPNQVAYIISAFQKLAQDVKTAMISSLRKASDAKC